MRAYMFWARFKELSLAPSCDLWGVTFAAAQKAANPEKTTGERGSACAAQARDCNTPSSGPRSGIPMAADGAVSGYSGRGGVISPGNDGEGRSSSIGTLLGRNGVGGDRGAWQEAAQK